jgi:hypothetical protein
MRERINRDESDDCIEDDVGEEDMGVDESDGGC